MSENVANTYQTTLSAAITGTGDSTCSVTSATGAPAANFRILIDTELMLVTNVSGTTLSITRGIEGTSAATHSNGTTVTHILTAVGLGKSTLSVPDQPRTGAAVTGDDEFDTTDTNNPVTGWTVMGTVTACDTNSTLKSCLYLKRAQISTYDLGGLYKAYTPSNGDTITAKVTGRTWQGNFHKAGIFLGEATPGKTIGIYSCNETASIWSFNSKQYSAPTGGTLTNNNNLAAASTPPVYLRITYTSSTSMLFSGSVDGIFWRAVSAAINPGFTVGCYGLVVSCENATTGVAVEALFDWIRFNWTPS